MSDGLLFEGNLKSGLLRSLQSAEGLKVLWWNVHDGRARAKREYILSQNLMALIHSDLSPDIMAFSEYRDTSIEPQTLAELYRLYPYHQLWGYPPGQFFGLVIYSKYPIKNTEMETLDFSPVREMSDAARKSYQKTWCATDEDCLRRFASFDIQWREGKTIQFVPVHLYDAWRLYSQRFGKVKTFQEIVSGMDNPVAYQLLRFKNKLLEVMNLIGGTPPTIIVGDFNIPKRITPARTPMYKALSKNLIDVINNNDASFPAESADEYGHYPDMQIDHAFLAGKIKSEVSEVLPLKGSDHYPLYLILNPNI